MFWGRLFERDQRWNWNWSFVFSHSYWFVELLNSINSIIIMGQIKKLKNKKCTCLICSKIIWIDELIAILFLCCLSSLLILKPIAFVRPKTESQPALNQHCTHDAQVTLKTRQNRLYFAKHPPSISFCSHCFELALVIYFLAEKTDHQNSQIAQKMWF